MTIKCTLPNCRFNRFLLLVIGLLPCILRYFVHSHIICLLALFCLCYSKLLPNSIELCPRDGIHAMSHFLSLSYLIFAKIVVSILSKLCSIHHFKFTSALLHFIIACLNLVQTHWHVPRKYLQLHKLTQYLKFTVLTGTLLVTLLPSL